MRNFSSKLFKSKQQLKLNNFINKLRNKFDNFSKTISHQIFKNISKHKSGLRTHRTDVGGIHEFPLHSNQVFGRILRKSYKSKNKLLPIVIIALVFLTTPLITLQFVHSADIDIKAKPEINRPFVNPKLIRSFGGHAGTIKSLIFTPDSKMLVSGGGDNDGIIRVWNPMKGDMMGIIRKAHKAAVESIVISPDNQTLASCSSDNTINLWNLKDYKFDRTFIGHGSNLLSLALSPDGKILASGGLDGIRLWDLLQRRPLGTLVRYDNVIYSLAISPDGQTLASGDNKGVIKLWDLSSGKLIRAFVAHRNIITSIRFTPEGQSLITASRDKAVKIWNLNTQQLANTLIGHTNWVNAIAINPNGTILASAGRDGLKIWDLQTGELINSIYGHSDWISAVAFSPDGTMLATGGFDKKVKIWLN